MTLNSPLISVIVPIYQIEKYLTTCLDSLAAQTYPNFEVILVDDGSSDNCPQICDKYAAKDARFKVIHQKNSGSVLARINAIPYTQGKLLAFVDGDDWIEPDYLSYLYDLRTNYQADISVCAPFGIGSLYMFGKKPFVADVAHALRIMCADKFYAGYIWNKLYPKKYWENLHLPPQNMFEDLCFNGQIFPQARKIVFSPKRLYHYRMVPGSISRQGFQENRLFFYTLTENMKQWVKSHQEMDAYCWLTNTQLITYIRNLLHYTRIINKSPRLWKQLTKTRPSLKWYFELNREFVYKWRSLAWLLVDNLVADIYTFLYRKRS